MLYLHKVLQTFCVDAGEVYEEFLVRFLQLNVDSLLSWSLQGTKYHGSQHQVEQHPGEDGEQGGAAHGCTSSQSECRLLLLCVSSSPGVALIPAAAAETSMTTKEHGFRPDHSFYSSSDRKHACSKPSYCISCIRH